MGESYPSAEVQSVYSIAVADWARIYVYVNVCTHTCKCKSNK